MANLGIKYIAFIIPGVPSLGKRMFLILQGGADSKASLVKRPLPWVFLPEKLVKKLRFLADHSWEERRVNLKMCDHVEGHVGRPEKNKIQL